MYVLIVVTIDKRSGRTKVVNETGTYAHYIQCMFVVRIIYSCILMLLHVYRSADECEKRRSNNVDTAYAARKSAYIV